jgi:hypothetical protein
MKRITFHYRSCRASESVKVLMAWAASVGLFFYAFIAVALYSAFLLLVIFAGTTSGIFRSLVNVMPHYTIGVALASAAAVLFVLVGIYPYYRFAREFSSKLKDVLDLKDLSVLPKRMEALANEWTNGLKENMSLRHARRLPPGRICYLYEKKNFTAVPSMSLRWV